MNIFSEHSLDDQNLREILLETRRPLHIPLLRSLAVPHRWHAERPSIRPNSLKCSLENRLPDWTPLFHHRCLNQARFDIPVFVVFRF